MNTLLNFSGGLDSTYALWNYLKTNDKRLLIHHCHLINWESRHEEETRSVDAILQWLVDNNLANFQYKHTTFNYGNNTYLIPDKEIIGFLTGVVVRPKAFKNITKVIISSSKDDTANIEYYVRSEQRRIQIMNVTARKELKLLYPIKNLTRTEMIRRLPVGLFELIWYCRKPVEGKPCKECKTCKQMEASKKEIG